MDNPLLWYLIFSAFVCVAGLVMIKIIFGKVLVRDFAWVICLSVCPIANIIFALILVGVYFDMIKDWRLF